MFHLLASYYHFLTTLDIPFQILATVAFVYTVIVSYTFWHKDGPDPDIANVMMNTMLAVLVTGLGIMLIAFVWPLVFIFATMFLTLHFLVCLVTRTPSPILAKLKALNKKD